MRITGGEFRGKNIAFVKSDETRPTADMVRQAFFTKFQFDIAGCEFLDLFAGSGAFGLDALSRGASRVVFLEKSPENCKRINQNLTSIKKTAKVICGDFSSALNKELSSFDFVYADPPFKKTEYYAKLFELIKNNALLKEGGVVCCEHISSFVPSGEGFVCFGTKKYGIKSLSFFRQNIEK